MTKVWGEIIQLAGLMFCMLGIGIEIYYEAHIGFISITVGSLLFAVGTKIKHREKKDDARRRNPFINVNW